MPVRQNNRTSSELTAMNIEGGMDYKELVDKMKMSGYALGGYQSGNAHASLIVSGPTGQMPTSQFFSP